LFSFNRISALDLEFRDAIALELLKRSKLKDVERQPAIKGLISSNVNVLDEFEHHFIISKPPGMQVDVDGDLNCESGDIEDRSNRKPSRIKPNPKQGSSSLRQIIQAAFPQYPITQDPIHAHGILHRLDMNTSGCLMIAKTYQGFYEQRIRFACNEIEKKYDCIVHGTAPNDSLPLKLSKRLKTESVFSGGEEVGSTTRVSESQGKPAVTVIEDVKQLSNDFSWLRISLETGRTHQIRAHLSDLGFPIVNDVKYGAPKAAGRTLLHCSSLDSTHCPLPDDFLSFM
jgi:23S rRNA-/tRNA-specific pseudouridylate synthase